MSSGWAAIHERSVSDMLASERQIRAALEGEYRKLAVVLERLARQHHGVFLEDQRRTNPDGFQHWTAQDWENFFQMAPRDQPKIHPVPDWGAVSGKNGNNGHSEAAKLEMEIQRLKKEVGCLKAENMELLQNGRTPHRPNVPLGENAGVSKTGDRGRIPVNAGTDESTKAPGVKKENQQAGPAPHTHAPGFIIPNETGESFPDRATPFGDPGSSRPPNMADFKMPLLPLKYSHLEADFGGLQWRRAVMILYLLAHYGLNAHIEIDRHIAPVEGLSFRTNSTKKPVQKLDSVGLIAAETLKISHPQAGQGFALRLLRLTDTGRDLCQALGFQPVESEWERLIRLHQGAEQKDHTLAVLYFALLARARGYDIAVLPDEKAGKTPPDVCISRGDETHLVEIELGQRDLAAKWRNLKTAQGHAAICALRPAGRQRLVKDCQLAKIPGMATDLETLKAVRIYETTDADPLWLEEWQ